jgi:uncharacterized delta-60 repeat protein
VHCATDEPAATDGVLDQDFGCNGASITEIDGVSIAYDVAVQRDGRILVVGGTGMNTAGGTDNTVALVRYNPDGTLDIPFGDGGLAETKLDQYLEGHSVALQPDGRIVIAGSASYDRPGRVTVARYERGGTLDRTFASVGWMSIATLRRAAEVLAQPNGGILVTGPSLDGWNIVRLNSNGTIDTRFSRRVGDGSFKAATDAAHAMALQRDGRLVVAGTARGRLALERFMPNGRLDTSFGMAGRVTTRVGAAAAKAFAVDVQPDGKIVAGGQAGRGIVIARYERSGALDASFGVGGLVIEDVTNQTDAVRSVGIGPDGGVVAVVGDPPGAAPRHSAFLMLRYNVAGGLERPIAESAVAFPRFGRVYATANALAVQPDGEIIAVGAVASSGYESRFAVARFLA